jgi:hypothetical protein
MHQVKQLFGILLLILPLQMTAQIGGRALQDFLRLSPSGRISSLGGVNVSTWDDDPHFGYMNPALVNDSMHQQVALSYAGYLSDIGFGYTGYSHTFDGIGSFHTGINYLNYGSFQAADDRGNLLNEFRASSLAWVVGGSRGSDNLRVGTNLKFIYSTLASGYAANFSALALDLGGAYRSKSRLFSAGIVAKNIGLSLNETPVGIPRENLPFELQLGMTAKLRYMPLRFSVTATHLEHPNLIYEDPNAPQEFDLSGNPIEQRDPILDKIVRHFVFGGEFLLGKGLRLRGGYNHLRRQELRSSNRAGLSGFSLGFGLRIKRFALDYGYASYGADNNFNTHQFSLRMRLN